MLVTPLLQKGVGVVLPKARNVHAVSENDQEVLVVAVTEHGDVYVGEDVIDKKKVEEVLRTRLRANAALELQIKADRNTHFKDVRAIVRAGRDAGFSGAALLAEEIKEPGAAPGGTGSPKGE
jgi:biopolymer transport protein ExbD